MKRLGIAAALAGIVGAVWYLRRPVPTAAAPSAAPATAATSAPAAAPAPAKPIAHVTKLASPDERKQMADRIATAQSARASGGHAATHAPAPPRLPDNLPDDGEDTPITKTEIRAAMREVIPIIKECYEAAIPTLPSPDITVTAKMTLSGDPDVGTLIDAGEILDDQGKPLPAKFDDCLRSTFQTLALPPLAEGDKLEVHYPFRFAHN
jgi:hypothetical protein